MSTLINPIPSALPGTAEAADAAIESLRLLLDANVSWLTGRSFGRARAIPRILDPTKGTKVIEPLVYTANKEYYPALPNDALTAFSFWYIQNPRTPFDYRDHSFPKNFSTPASLVVWGNLNKISPLKDYIYTEELINQVMAVLNNTSKVEVVRIFDEDIKRIYQGFDIDPSTLGLLMFPYFAFRIEVTLRYMIECPETGPIANIPPPSVAIPEGSVLQYIGGEWVAVTLQQLNQQLADTPI